MTRFDKEPIIQHRRSFPVPEGDVRTVEPPFDLPTVLPSRRRPVPVPVRKPAPEVPPNRLQTIRRGNFLPFSVNPETGEWWFDPTTGFVGDAVDAATLPARVSRGEVDLNTDEGLREAIGMGLTFTPGGVGRGAVLGTRPRSIRTGKVIPRPVPPPRFEVLRATADEAYREADKAGVRLSRGGYARAVESMLNAALKKGFTSSGHPEVNEAIQTMARELNGEPTISQINQLRASLARAVGSKDPDEQRIAHAVTRALDDFMGRLSKRDAVAIDPLAGAPALRKARKLWTKVGKSEVIERAYRNARVTADGVPGADFETALWKQLRLINKDDALMSRFNRRERAAIKRAVFGGDIAKALRRLELTGDLSVYAPRGGAIAGGLLAGQEGVATGYAVGASVPHAATIGRQLFVRQAGRDANLARQMALGGNPPRADEQALWRARRLLFATLERPVTGAAALETILEPAGP